MQNIYKALAGFQQEIPTLIKDTSGYGYKYTDLPAIFEQVNPLLKKYGLGFTQPLNGNKIKTILFHCESGETIESETDLPIETLIYEDVTKPNSKGILEAKSVIKGFEGMNKAQAIGSLITYFRRYSLSSLLGLVTDKDTDGSGKKGDGKQLSETSDEPF